MEDFTQEVAKSLGIKPEQLTQLSGNGGGGEAGDIWDHKGTLQAVYMGVKPVSTGSKLYKFQKKDGEAVAIWSCKIMDDVFLTLPVGTEVIIKYAGKQKTKKGTFFKNYQIFKLD